MRILAVTGDANLLTAITSMMRDWEIEHVREAKEAASVPAGSVLALVATGSTEKGLQDAQTLWQSGVTLPCLVIGDVPAPPGARVRVLSRPFTLQDLAESVTEVSEAGPIAPYDESVVEDVLPEPPAPEPEAEAPPEEPEPAPEPVLGEAPAPEEPEPEPVQEPKMGHDPGVAEEAPPAAPKPQEPAPAASVAAAPPAVKPAPPVQHVAPAAPKQEAPSAPASARPVDDQRERRRFLRRRPEGKRPEKQGMEEDPTVTRLKAAIASARDLEMLLAELPVLGQPRAMAHAFLGEVVEMFAPQVAAVYAAGVDGSFSAIAAHGLSSVEAGMKVPPSQPLFMEIATGCEAVLISPVDLAQGLVAGIGGARTESLLVAPLEVTGMCHAIVVVGRQDFTEFDLDLLSELAEEAAPGLAVAQLLERLRSL